MSGILTDECREMMRVVAEGSFPNEACGLVLDDSTFVAIENVHSSPEDSYTLNADQQWAAWEKYGERIIGIFHSHPRTDAVPSGMDIAFAIPGFLYVIYSVAHRELRWWRIENGEAEELPG